MRPFLFSLIMDFFLILMCVVYLSDFWKAALFQASEFFPKFLACVILT